MLAIYSWLMLKKNEIQKYTPEGNLITKWGSPGQGNGQFSWPEGIAVDTAGNVYIADTGNHRIQKFGLVSSAVRSFKSSSNLNRNNILNRNIEPHPRNIDLQRRDNLDKELNRTQRQDKKQQKKK